MPRPVLRLAFVASTMVALLGGCTLIDLSDLQRGAGGKGTSSGSTTSSQGGSTPCGGISCSSHGHCDESTGAPTCVCDSHFSGPECDSCAVGYTGDGCLGCDVGYQDADYDGSCLPSCTTTTCSGNGACSDASGTAVCTCASGYTGSDCSTMCPIGTAGTDCSFKILYGLDIPTTANWNVITDVPYDIDNTASAGSFSRVAYLLVLDRQSVWVEMDAFTTDATKLGVPCAWQWQIAVTNAQVSAVSPNLSSIPTPTTGGIEFWSDCYKEGPDGQFDDHDMITDSACYGSMQVAVGGSTVLAFNGWSQNTATDLIDVGIGRSTSGSPDWTFAGNAPNFSKRRLEVYIHP